MSSAAALDRYLRSTSFAPSVVPVYDSLIHSRSLLTDGCASFSHNPLVFVGYLRDTGSIMCGSATRLSAAWVRDPWAVCFLEDGTELCPERGATHFRLSEGGVPEWATASGASCGLHDCARVVVHSCQRTGNTPPTVSPDTESDTESEPPEVELFSSPLIQSQEEKVFSGPSHNNSTKKSVVPSLISFDKIVYPPTPDLTRVRKRRSFLEALPSPLSTPKPIVYQNPPRTGLPNPKYDLINGAFVLKKD